MRVAGIQLTAAAAAHLVVLLNRAKYTALAQRLGRAVDADVEELPITSRDRRPILDVLAEHTKGPLATLRETLERDSDPTRRTKLD